MAEPTASRELFARAGAGDPRALAELCALYLPRLKRCAGALLSGPEFDELDGEALVREAVLQTVAAARPGRADSLVLGVLREAVRQRASGTSFSPLAQTVGREALLRYEHALSRLAGPDRERVVARLEMGCSYDELAREQGRGSRAEARNGVVRALVRLGTEMGGSAAAAADEGPLFALAAALADGVRVDWRAAAGELPPPQRPLLAELQVVAAIAETFRVVGREGEGAATIDFPPPTTPLTTAPPAPARWGHLELRGRLGSGGFGEVFRAWDPRLEREVALKLLRRADEGSGLVQEGRLLARVRHPNVVAVYGADEADGRVGIWMELVRGRTLDHLLAERGPFGAPEAALVGLELCRALAAVHQAGLVHRDVKGGNAMREDGGRIVLMDFGIGRDLHGLGEAPGRVRGTPLYLAPELLAGAEATPRADVYGLGVLLFHLVSGEYPVRGQSFEDLFRAHQERRLTRLRDVRSDLPRRFVAAVEQALEPDPAQRLATMGALEAALAAVLEREGGPVTPTGGSPLALPRAATASAAACAAPPIQRVAEAVEELGRLVDHAGARSAGDDRALQVLSDFLGEGTRAVEALTAVHAAGLPHPEVLALALSVGHLARELVARLAPQAAAGGDLAACLRRVQAAVLAPAEALAREAREGASAEEAFPLFDEPSATPSGALDAQDVGAGLLSGEALAVHEAVLAVAASPAAFAEYLAGREGAAREALLQALWGSADVLLLQARGRARVVIEAGARAEGAGLRLGWSRLLQLFRRSNDDVAAARVILAAAAPAERRVLARCLLFHPAEGCRMLALGVLQPADCWEVIAHPDTPAGWLLEMWKSLRPAVGAGFVKVFLVCVRETLLRPAGPDRLVSVIELLQQFYEVDAFHEDVFFHMLAGLDEHVREEARRHHLRLDLDQEYLSRFHAFRAAGARHDQPTEGWTEVPLPVQRRLARRGHFLEHFACHPVDAIALECLPHIVRQESGGDYAGLNAINARLLLEMARERHLFVREEARYNLVANPKTPAHVAMTWLRSLRKDSLKKLSDSRDCNSFSRNFAKKLLGAS